jgi:hypothetical protein
VLTSTTAFAVTAGAVVEPASIVTTVGSSTVAVDTWTLVCTYEGTSTST